MPPRPDPRRRARAAAARTEPAPAAPPREVAEWQLLLGLVLLHLLLTYAVMTPAPHLGGDNAAYLGLARSLLEGHGYREIWDPAQPPHAMYPPGFPALLALGMALGLEPWLGLKVLVAVLSSAAIAASYLWLRRVADRPLALGVALVLSVAPGVLVQSATELSDVPFWLFVALVLWCFSRAEDAASPEPSADGGRRELAWVAAAGVAAGAAWLTRSAALPLVLAVCAWLVLRRRWKALALFAAVLAPPVLGWWAWQRHAATGVSYVTAFWWKNPYDPEAGTIDAPTLVRRIGINAWKYLHSRVPILLLGDLPEAICVLVGAGVLALALYGWARRARRPGLPELFLPLYAALLLVWPDEWPDVRFVLPVLPLVLLYAALAARELGERAGRRRLATAVALGGLLLPGVFGFASKASDAARCRSGYPDLGACYPPLWSAMFTLFQQTKGQLPAGSVILSRKPTLAWAFSGYPSRVYPYSANPDSFFAGARRARAQYVVVDGTPESGRYVRPALSARREDFCVVRAVSTQGAVLVKITRNHAAIPRNADPNFMVYCPGN